MSANIYFEYDDGSVNLVRVHDEAPFGDDTFTDGGEFTFHVTRFGVMDIFDNMREAIGDEGNDYADGGIIDPTPGWEDEPVLSYMETFYGEKFANHYAIPETHTVGAEFDPVARPAHYTEGRDIEPINVIEDWELDFHLGNALKYISRIGRKSDGVEDMKKAVWYLERRIEAQEQDNG